MAEAYVSPDGVVTIPESVRNALGLQNGGKVDFLQFVEGQVTLVARNLSVEVLNGILPRPNCDCTVEEMIDLAAKYAALDK